MNTAVVGSEAVDLLSRITGQKLSQRYLTPSVIFLAALVTVLLGVMFADSTVTDEDKQRLLKTLNRFNPPEGDGRRLTHLIIKGVREHQIYGKTNELLRLIAPLSEAERLLLIGFGYEMSAAEGAIARPKKKYLQTITNQLGINPGHLAVLEAGFTNQGTVEPAALDEVCFLLNPAQLHSLDAAFVKASGNMITVMHSLLENQTTQQYTACSYEELKKFQKYRQQLKTACDQLIELIDECTTRSVLPHSLTEEIRKVSDKLHSQRFRVAVVGEFSQGKSTLLNALLGEEIQPVREIPCSGTVTVFKYGAQKRIVCRYKDGREEEIPFHQYKDKAAISEDAALDYQNDELTPFEIEEIIFEHPDLEICRYGIEIVDSPGLNENSARTTITQKLLKDTDAAIFLTNASRSLTQGERDLLQDLRTQLNGGKKDEPADNLFVVGNFMDLVRTEKGRQQVQERIERFVQGQSPIVAGENRVHFISAQATLNAILKRTEDVYLKSFQAFSQSLEKFLTTERSLVKRQQSVTQLKKLIQSCQLEFNQAENKLDEKVKDAEVVKQGILEQIGEASGRDVRIRLLAYQLIDQVVEQAAESWDEWHEGLLERMLDKSESWHSEHNPVWSQNKLIQDYSNQFTENLLQEIDDWGNSKLKDAILKHNIEVLEQNITQEIKNIQAEFKSIENQVKTDFSEQLNLSIDGINDDFAGNRTVWDGIGLGSALFAGLLAFTGFGLVALIIASIAGTIVGEFGLGMLGLDGIKDQIKLKVFEIGFQKFEESLEKVSDNLYKFIGSVFDNRVESAIRVIVQAISLYENLLEHQESEYQKILEQCGAEKAWISQKRGEMEEVASDIKAILNQSAG